MQGIQINSALIKNLIDSDIHNANELLKLLESEKSALELRQHESLKSLISEKKQIIATLEQNATGRQQILKQLGKADKPENWRELINNFGLNQTWLELEQCLKRCDELNQINERIISRTQQSVGRLLDIFRGQFGQTGIYNEKGSKHNRGNSLSRSITTA